MFETEETAEVVIVGGGVIGLAIARALRRRGVREVMLIERAQPGAEASWAAGGIIGPQLEADRNDAFFELACASRDMYPEFANALREETGIDVELDTAGTLYLSFTKEDEEELGRRFRWQAKRGFRIEWLTGAEARAAEPNVSERVRCAIRFPNDFQVENRKLVKALVAAGEKLGVRLITGCEVARIEIARGRVQGVQTSLGFVATANVVLAAGAWTSFVDSPDVALPAINIEPVRGQMLCFQTAPREFGHVLYTARGYLVPRRDGRVLAGSTLEHAGFDKSVTSEAAASIKSMAFEIAPALEHSPLIDSWAGFRPRTADDLPVLGRCRNVEGLIYATGHYRNGILLAPITGEAIADLILSGMTPPLIETFSPDRFEQKKLRPDESRVLPANSASSQNKAGGSPPLNDI
ncbi:MAG: glycine oxidase ThiO [Acidobacteria bacterium]|nr:MAG: glycine oxidase ThiO [Acidobacteriota bacterium]